MIEVIESENAVWLMLAAVQYRRRPLLDKQASKQSTLIKPFPSPQISDAFTSTDDPPWPSTTMCPNAADEGCCTTCYDTTDAALGATSDSDASQNSNTGRR
jgi:hypothetical protein